MRSRIEIFWPLKNRYHAGNVDDISNGKTTVEYDYGDVELLNHRNETWRLCSVLCLAENSSPTIQLLEVYTQMLEYFGNKPFMQYEATNFRQLALFNVYDYEEEKF